jgi:hypothetical protein
VDPLYFEYAYNSTYSFSESNVISHIELEGLEATLPQYHEYKAALYITITQVLVNGVLNEGMSITADGETYTSSRISYRGDLNFKNISIRIVEVRIVRDEKGPNGPEDHLEGITIEQQNPQIQIDATDVGELEMIGMPTNVFSESYILESYNKWKSSESSEDELTKAKQSTMKEVIFTFRSNKELNRKEKKLIQKSFEEMTDKVKSDYGSQTKVKIKFVVDATDSNNKRMDIGNERQILTVAPNQGYEDDFNNAINLPQQ